ncbi:IS66 family insertion sequence element accessory protein TnpB [Escherichia coli]
MSDMQKNVTPGRRKGCPNYPPEFKQLLVAASCEPGISISKLALENGINANLLFKWRQQWREGKLLLPSSESPQLLPVTLDAAAEQPESLAEDPETLSISCEVTFRHALQWQCQRKAPDSADTGTEAMIPLPSGTKIWLVAGITDMRNGFNGLAAKVQTALKDDPMSGHVFIFRGRSGSQVKLLWSTGDGLCLLTKRLERGRFAWPSARDGKVFLTQAQLAMLLEGIDWRQPKRLLTSLTML